MNARSPYDTQRFGMVVHRTFCDSVDEADQALRNANEDGAELLILRFPSTATSLGAWMLGLAHRWTFADTLVYYQRPIKKRLTMPCNPSYQQRLASADDAERVARLINELFTGYPSHYRWNPLTDKPEELGQGYAEWAHRLVSDRSTFCYLVESDDGDLAAAACTQMLGDRGDVLVGGVSAKHGRQGLYRWIVDGTYNCLLDRRIEAQQISTQVHNYAVQKVWTRCGMEIFKAVQTVHVNLTSNNH